MKGEDKIIGESKTVSTRQDIFELWTNTGQAVYKGTPIHYAALISPAREDGIVNLILLKNGHRSTLGYASINDLLFGESNLFEVIFGVEKEEVFQDAWFRKCDYKKFDCVLAKDKLKCLIESLPSV